MNPTRTAEELLVLAAVRDGRRRPAEIRKPAAAARNAAIASLVAAGLLREQHEGRTVTLELTEAGAGVAAAVESGPATKRAARPAVAKPDAGTALEAMQAALARVEAKLDLLLSARGATPPGLADSSVAPSAAPAPATAPEVATSNAVDRAVPSEAATPTATDARPAPTQAPTAGPQPATPTDAPRADAPRAAPPTVAPRADAPRAGAPPSDAPPTDAPRADAPRSDAATPTVASEARPRTVPLDVLKRIILDAVRHLDARHRYGGLVPLPALRQAVSVISSDRESVDTALESLERDYAIDLNIAQIPGQVAEREAGIERPGRGLLYYVARRS